MIAGHSAGVAAAQAVRDNVPVHGIDLLQFQHRLQAQKQVLSLSGQ